MRFAKIVFNTAGIYGLLVLLPHYFLETKIGDGAPPPINHPEYFYGFVGVGIAWQLAFLVIAADPLRYRLLMLPAIAEKWLFTASTATLLLQHRSPVNMIVPVALDFVLGVFFLLSFIKTGKENTARA